MNQMVVRVAFHPLAWERVRPLLEAQNLDPVKLNGELMVTPTVEQERGWRRQAALKAIPEGDLVLERIPHDGTLGHEGDAGVRIRHLPTQITVDATNHRNLLRNKIDALEVLADQLLELEEKGVTPTWRTNQPA